jgi:hypothetical protein
MVKRQQKSTNDYILKQGQPFNFEKSQNIKKILRSE